MIFGNSITVFAHERGDEDTNIIYDNVGYIYISFCFGLDEINEVNCEISGLEVGNKISDVELLISESAKYFIKPLGYNEDETLCNYQWTDLNSDEMNLMSDNDKAYIEAN